MKEAAVNGVISIFGDNLRAAGLDRSYLPEIKRDKELIGSLYGFSISAADVYGEDVDGMSTFIIAYSKIFGVTDPKEIEVLAHDALFDDEVNKEAEKTFNYLLNIADSGLSQKEAMLFMRDSMAKYAIK